MRKLTFKGGIHPYDGKELSKDSPIEKYLPQGEMVYPLSQHIGAPSAPCVAIMCWPDRKSQKQTVLYPYLFILLFPEP